jgi:outer membrane lipoprotein-sorting protein
VNSNGIRFATERQISVSERSKLDVDMNFKQFSFNETLDFKFPIPKNYKRD